MTRDKKILLGCAACIVLLCLCGCCGVFAMSAGLGSAVAPAMEGAQVGQQTRDHEACVEAAFTRADGCANMDLSCGFTVGAFEGGCLSAVPADPTAFCQSTLAAAALGDEAGAQAFCSERGRGVSFGCGVVFGGTADFCESHGGARP